MLQFSKKGRLFLLSFLCILVLILLSLDPKVYINATLNGLVVFSTILFPSLLPFFVFTKMLTNLQAINDICRIFDPITKFLFKAPSIASYILLMSIISGYPVGAKLVSECYNNGFITKKEAKKIITFTSNSGPMFVIGTVGAGLLFSKEAGYIILLAHILGSVINGIFYSCFLKTEKTTETIVKKDTDLNNLLSDAVYQSLQSLFMVGGFVALFFTLIELLNHYNLFYYTAKLFTPLIHLLQLDTHLVSSLLEGILEVTKGCFNVANLHLPLHTSILLCTGLISFGGICVMLQAMSFLKSCGISSRFYLLQKCTHMIFSIFIAFLLLSVF